MREILAYSTFFTTVGLVISRPRIGSWFRVGPGAAAIAGALAMVALGLIARADLAHAAATLWRPFVGIAAIMVTTAVADRLGVLGWVAARIEVRARGSARRLFTSVYVLAALTAAVMNNDAAVLILTPAVVVLVRRAFPERPGLVVPFAFAVFLAAGVAPLVVSNPMNMVMASRMGIDFNTYAIHMLPVSLAGWLVGYVLLRLIFRRALAGATSSSSSRTAAPRLARPQRHVLALLAASLLAYPILAHLGGPVWIVAVAVAAIALALARVHASASPVAVVREAVSWEILIFLAGAFLIALGLRAAGLVDGLATLYADGGSGTVGASSALGSALLNNHPMSQINLLALGDAPPLSSALAAMIGGDLGPRLLPIGSLAGLLWLESLRRQRVEVPVWRFVVVGVVVTVPALVVSLAIVSAY